MKRKISAILAADIAGYSRLVSLDEEETLRRLEAYRGVFRDFVAQKGGRIFNTAGDAVLAEFPSAVDAVRCAVDVQESVRARNLAYPPSRHMLFRMGVSIGDVVERDGDLLGDGVNIAARLEGLAKPGGICVSRSVYEQVAGKLSLTFSDAGPQRLKNIATPVHAYKVSLGPEANVQPAAMNRTIVVGAAMLGAVAMVIAAAVIVKERSFGPAAPQPTKAPTELATSAQAPAPPVPARERMPASDLDLDIAFWNSVRESNDPTLLQTYLDRFARGQFAELARRRITELRARKQQQDQPRPPQPPSEPSQRRDAPDRSKTAAASPAPSSPPSQLAAPSSVPVPAPPVPVAAPPATPASAPVSVPGPVPAPPAPAVAPPSVPVSAPPTVPPPAPAEPPRAAPRADNTALVRALQRELKRVGCLTGDQNGVWDQESRAAMKQFARLSKLTIEGEDPSVAVLDAATAAGTRVCPLACDEGEQIVKGRCVEKPRKARARTEEVRRAKPRPDRSAGEPSRPSPSPKLCFGARPNELGACR